ncbi:MAG: hypothetical protein PVF13_01760 [Chromatiales bacterium]|jgi:hypothetical protein
MVSPINGDKSITASTERTGESAKNSRSEQAAISPSTSQERKTAVTLDSTLEVDNARQLYDLESQPSRVSAAQINTPDEARSLLGQILEQFSNEPEQAMLSQGSRAESPLASLLQNAPG